MAGALVLWSTSVSCGSDTESSSSGGAFSIAEARAAQTTSTTNDPRRRTAVTEAVARVAPAVVTVLSNIVSRAAVDPCDWFFGRQRGNRAG
jgi:hypothetical protein